MERELLEMDMLDWFDEFKPISNHITDDASGGGRFETYGRELEYVKACFETDPLIVWTELDVEGQLIIVNGFSFVNRFGYYITEKPAKPDVDYQILDQEEMQ